MTFYDKNGNLSNILFNSYFLYGVTITHEEETILLCQELDREVGFNPFAILIPESLLGNLADVDFWVEVGCESLVMVSGVAIHDIEHLDFIEVMLGSVCGENAGNTWVETAAEDSAETCLPLRCPNF